MADFADPLGAGASLDTSASTLQDPTPLPTWGANSADVPLMAAADDSKVEHAAPPFGFDQAINDKISIWGGDLVHLQSDAVVNSTNEGLNENTALSIRLHKAAGPELRTECDAIGNCRTGDVRVTKAYNLPTRFVFHTVGPRFNRRYRTAAESALFSCCRSTLTELRERGLRTLGMPAINTPTRNYLTKDAAPIILRTIRRFLEAHGDAIDRVVLCLSDNDRATYHTVLPMYFPRSDGEAVWSATVLPEDIGNAEGEPVIEERKIRIMSKPRMSAHGSDSDDASDASESDDDEDGGKLSPIVFAAMTGDHDRQRREKLSHVLPAQDQRQLRDKAYQAMLKRARNTDLSHVAARRICAPGGTDKMGRRVFSITCKNVTEDLDRNEVIMSVLNTMDNIVNKPYIVVCYFTQSSLGVGSSLLKNVFEHVDGRYRANLKHVYTVHASVLGKVSSWFSAMTSDTGFKDKTTNFGGLRQLFDVVSPEQVDVPDLVWKHDEKCNGAINSQTGFIGAGEDL